MREMQSTTVRLFRFDPGSDAEPRYTQHPMAYDEHTTVLDLLEAIHDTAEPFAFQRECRMFKCGSCAVKVNSRPVLACKKRIQDLGDPSALAIEPLTCFPLIKDLLVDFSPDLTQRAKLRPFPEAASAGVRTGSVTGADGDVLRQYTSCIRCAVCVQACADRGPGRKERVNPLHLLDLARLASDPRDRAARVLEALSEGLTSGDDCRECDRVCPVGLKVFELSVGRLRTMLPAQA